MKNKKHSYIFTGAGFIVLFFISFVGIMFISKGMFWMLGVDINNFNVKALTGFGSLNITYYLFLYIIYNKKYNVRFYHGVR